MPETSYREPANLSLDDAEDVAMKMARRGASVEKIVESLTSDGVHPATAATIARSAVERCESSREEQAAADKRTGGILLALGAGLTLLTYLAAAEGGGVYYVTWGPMLYGFYRLLRGSWGRSH